MKLDADHRREMTVPVSLFVSGAGAILIEEIDQRGAQGFRPGQGVTIAQMEGAQFFSECGSERLKISWPCAQYRQAADAIP